MLMRLVSQKQIDQPNWLPSCRQTELMTCFMDYKITYKITYKIADKVTDKPALKSNGRATD